MLREISDVRQIPGDPRRRWFSDDAFDLIVWESRAGGIAGFQLCYDNGGDQRALTWAPEAGLRHCAVDTGESRPGKPKSVPILVCDVDKTGPPCGGGPPAAVVDRFRRASRGLDPVLARVILGHLAPDPDA
jgi:hypothetical protein